ncbi:pyridoxal phosphate-dependent aminotransferase [Nocardia stercoris]|uniref:Aminotransferase n=1 Tax=Nocardia stercoris TaxID=2483361 RepID=A0A3M2LB60_9NOCA|nr:pyridoxal phosphate-dependent aminotransferase [Nocardia stercoris]RMI31868.1 aminotransferase class I/II-fold pyridoxal phosphate-dependent enzyme [Nocardia stercoris]
MTSESKNVLSFRPALLHTRTQEIAYIARICQANPDTLDLCFGQSDLPTPPFIVDALERAIAEGKTTYAYRRGVEPLRRAIHEYHQKINGVDLDMERISAVSSGMSGIMISLQCLVEPGDNVVVVAPVWPNIVIAIEAMGAEVRFVNLEQRDGAWELDLAAVEAASDDRTRAIFVTSPSNPTGWVMPSQQQREVLDLARRLGTWVIADEVYSRIVYDGATAAASFLEVATDEDPLFVIQSFSKAWSMTGWRLGWVVHPTALAIQVGNLSAINSTGSATFVQHAGVTAIRDGEPFVKQMQDHSARGRRIVAEAFAGHDRILAPQVPASFFAYFRIDGVDNSLAFAEDLVTRGGVGIAPGSAFGPGNDGWFRICFAQEPGRLQAALDRLIAAV